MSQEDAEAEINGILYKLLGVMLVTMLICIAVAWVIANGLVKGINAELVYWKRLQTAILPYRSMRNTVGEEMKSEKW